ncbi:hypothetical protein COBT_001703, partial [Conglomerata obtusa]
MTMWFIFFYGINQFIKCNDKVFLFDGIESRVDAFFQFSKVDSIRDVSNTSNIDSELDNFEKTVIGYLKFCFDQLCTKTQNTIKEAIYENMEEHRYDIFGSSFEDEPDVSPKINDYIRIFEAKYYNMIKRLENFIMLNYIRCTLSNPDLLGIFNKTFFYNGFHDSNCKNGLRGVILMALNSIMKPADYFKNTKDQFYHNIKFFFDDKHKFYQIRFEYMISVLRKFKYAKNSVQICEFNMLYIPDLKNNNHVNYNAKNLFTIIENLKI